MDVKTHILPALKLLIVNKHEEPLLNY